MQDDLDETLRSGLRGVVSDITPATVVRKRLPEAHRRSGLPIVGVGLVVAAVVLGAFWVGSLPGAPVSSSDSVASTSVEGSAAERAAVGVQILDSTAIVDGAVFPLPKSWKFWELPDEPLTDARQLCLSPNQVSNQTCNGIMIKIAVADSVGNYQPIPGGMETTCPAGLPTIMTLTEAKLGGRAATGQPLQCGEEGPRISFYWALSDRTLTVQTPQDGTLMNEGEDLAGSINLAAWLHSAPLTADAATLASSATG